MELENDPTLSHGPLIDRKLLDDKKFHDSPCSYTKNMVVGDYANHSKKNQVDDIYSAA